MSLENYKLYRETQLVILEASNMFDIVDIQSKNINMYAEGDFSWVAAFNAFCLGCIMLCVKIILGLKALILGVGIAFLLWVIKSLFTKKSDNIKTSGGGGGGSSSYTVTYTITTLRKSEDKPYKAKAIKKAVEKGFSQKTLDYLKGIPGFDECVKNLNDIIKSDFKGKPFNYNYLDKHNLSYDAKAILDNNIYLGVDTFNPGAFAINTKLSFIPKVIDELLKRGESLSGVKYSSFTQKQPFYAFDAEAMAKADSDIWTKIKNKINDNSIVPLAEFSADIINNADSIMATGLLAQEAVLSFLGEMNGGDSVALNKSTYKLLVENTLSSIPGRMKKQVKEMESLLSFRFNESTESLFPENRYKEETVLDCIGSCKYKLDSYEDYNKVSKMYASLKTKVVKERLRLFKMGTADDMVMYDVLYADTDDKLAKFDKNVFVNIVEAITASITDGGMERIDEMKEAIRKLSDSSKDLKTVFDELKIDKKQDTYGRLQQKKDFLKKTQEFSINLLAILNQSIALGPMCVNNSTNEVYKEILNDIVLIFIHVMSQTTDYI